MAIRNFTFFLTLLLAAGCSAQTITAAQAYNPDTMPGPWLFQDGYGHHLTITSTPARCEIGICDGNWVEWSYDKDACQAYWNPGKCDQLNALVLHHDLPGQSSLYAVEQWRVTGFRWTHNGQPYTATVWPNPTVPLAYIFIPGSGTNTPSAHSTGLSNSYRIYYQKGFTTDCVGPTNTDGSSNQYWDSTWTTFAWTTTMMYQGQMVPVLASDQCEGGPSGQCELVHEITFFADGRGPIAIWPIVGLDDNGAKLVFNDPLLIMYRIN